MGPVTRYPPRRPLWLSRLVEDAVAWCVLVSAALVGCLLALLAWRWLIE